VVPSFFFGFIHLDPRQGLMAMFMGLWLHFVYLTTRSLWLPMLLHFLNNSFSVATTHYGAFKELDDNGAMPAYLVVASALLMAGIGWALYRSRARLVPEGDGAGLWEPPYPGVMYPPAGSGTRVAHPRPSWDALATATAGFLVFVAACVKAMLH
jgi:uncharacterized protein